MIFIWNITHPTNTRILCRFVADKHFDHHSQGISAHADCWQSTNLPLLYACTMLHEHLVDFSATHVCWRLHFSELLAGILSSSKTLKPLQLVPHSMPPSSLILHVSTSDCLPAIGANAIDLLSSPLGSQSPSEWKNSQSTSATATDAGRSSICNSSEHHILWYLTWEQFFSVRIKILGRLTWVALTFCLKQG